jgi:hypothetical protein
MFTRIEAGLNSAIFHPFYAVYRFLWYRDIRKKRDESWTVYGAADTLDTGCTRGKYVASTVGELGSAYVIFIPHTPYMIRLTRADNGEQSVTLDRTRGKWLVDRIRLALVIRAERYAIKHMAARGIGHYLTVAAITFVLRNAPFVGYVPIFK